MSAHTHQGLRVARVPRISLKYDLFSSSHATCPVLIAVTYGVSLSSLISKLDKKPEQKYFRFVPRGGKSVKIRLRDVQPGVKDVAPRGNKQSPLVSQYVSQG